MAAIFQIRRGSGSVSLVDGELYLHEQSRSIYVGTENTSKIQLAKLDEVNTGSFNVTGDITLGGNIYLGDNLANDSVNVNSVFSGSIIPSGSNVFDLGSSTNFYRKIYGQSITGSFTGSIFGMGDPTAFVTSVDNRLDGLEIESASYKTFTGSVFYPFSASVDNRLDRVEASASLYDNAMSGSNRLYVSPSGSDSYDGKDPSTPFRTIKAAVESLGSAVFTNRQPYTIFVGSGEYTEQNPIAVPPGVAIVGDTLRTVRLYAANPTKDYFHCHDGNYFYGLRFLNLQNPSFCFSYPCSTATGSISAGSVSSIEVVHSMTGYTDGNNQDLGIIIEGPNSSGSIATATANVVGGVITQINVTHGGTNYRLAPGDENEKPHISIPAPVSKRPIIGTSPYIQNCSSITGPFTTDGTLLSLVPGNANYARLPYNINDVRNESNAVIGSGVIDEQGAGGGIRIDGNLVHPSSPLESFVADAFTQVNQGGPGHLVINKGYAQFVSCFTTFCTYGFKTANGGFANISNSVIDFGAKGLISKTYFPTTYNTGSSLETKTSQVSGFVIDENGAGYVGPTAIVTITGGGASVQATAEATVNANGSIDEIVLLTGGSGYTSQPNVAIAAPTGPGAIQATTVAGKALITGVAEMLMSLESGSRGIDISSNMILKGVDYLVTDVAAVSGQPNQRRVTTYPAPPSIAENDQIRFHQLSNISTGGLVMEYVGSGVTYNALPKFGGVPIRTREINEVAPGRVFYSTVDNIGNLKIGDFFAVNQLTGEVTIDANSFNLSGLNAIGPFKRNGAAVGVVLQEVSNNTTLLNSQGLFGEDTVPTQYAVKEYIKSISSSLDSRLDLVEATASYLNTTFSSSVDSRLDSVEAYTASVSTSVGLLQLTASYLNTTFSTSVDSRLDGLEIESASYKTFTGSVFYPFSASVDSRLDSVEAYTASVSTSVAALNSYSKSLKDAITVTGVDTNSLTTIRGDFRVLGTSSIITSQHIHLDDNIIELNGTGETFGGFLVKDPTGISTVSGSLKWNTNLDRWEAGKDEGDITSISKILLAGGDNVISSSAQLTNLNTFTASVTSSLVSIYQTTASLNLFSASVTSSLVSIYQTTGSLNLFSASLYTSASLMTASIASLTASVVTLQAFSGNVDTRFSTLATFTGSVETRLTEIGVVSGSLITSASAAKTTNDSQGVSITNLNASSASQQISIDALNTFSGSENTKAATLATYTASVETRFSTLAIYTGSVDTRFTSLANVTSSLITSASLVSSSVWHLHQFSSSQLSKDATLATLTGSYDTRFTTIGSVTASYDSRFTSLATITGSLIVSASQLYVSTSLMTASVKKLREDVQYLYDIGGISGNDPLGPLNIFSASINTFTSSINTTIKTKLDLDGVISGAAQIAITDLDGYTGFADGIITDINEKLSTSSFNSYTASQSTASLVTSITNLNSFTASQSTASLVTSITNLNNATSSYETKGRGIVSGSSQVLGGSGVWSGSAQLPSGVISGSSQILGGTGIVSGSSQIVPLLPNGVVSGSSQVITANSITLGTHTTGAYIQTITGTTNQITVAGSGLESAEVTLSLPQNIHSSATPQFSSLGIGTAASGVGGEIRATGDIVAFYSSDERLKSNIQPIGDALDKVNQISGNVYDWKEGFENIHSHTGTDIGVIAQEIEKVLPQAVIDRESGYKAVNYEKIVPLLIEAIKELSLKVKELENK